MFRTLTLGLLSTLPLLGTGCLWNKQQSNKGENSSISSMFTKDSKPLLVGPQGSANAAPQELPANEAAVARLTAAHEMAKAGQVEEAIRLYESARQDSPQLANAISRRLAVLYDKAGKFHLAREEYALALKSSPTDVELINDIGYSYYSQNDFMNAEKYFRQATQLQPQHKRAWMNLGLTLGAKGNFQGSYEAFMMAVTPGEAHCNLAFILAGHEKIEEAKSEYRKAMEIEPGNQLARAGLHNLENPKPIKEVKHETPQGNFKRADASSVPNILDIMERQRREEDAKASVKQDK